MWDAGGAEEAPRVVVYLRLPADYLDADPAALAHGAVDLAAPPPQLPPPPPVRTADAEERVTWRGARAVRWLSLPATPEAATPYDRDGNPLCQRLRSSVPEAATLRTRCGGAACSLLTCRHSAPLTPSTLWWSGARPRCVTLLTMTVLATTALATTVLTITTLY